LSGEVEAGGRKALQMSPFGLRGTWGYGWKSRRQFLAFPLTFPSHAESPACLPGLSGAGSLARRVLALQAGEQLALKVLAFCLKFGRRRSTKHIRRSRLSSD